MLISKKNYENKKHSAKKKIPPFSSVLRTFRLLVYSGGIFFRKKRVKFRRNIPYSATEFRLLGITVKNVSLKIELYTCKS